MSEKAAFPRTVPPPSWTMWMSSPVAERFPQTIWFVASSGDRTVVHPLGEDAATLPGIVPPDGGVEQPQIGGAPCPVGLHGDSAAIRRIVHRHDRVDDCHLSRAALRSRDEQAAAGSQPSPP